LIWDLTNTKKKNNTKKRTPKKNIKSNTKKQFLFLCAYIFILSL
jgi:hypothetical protein